MLLLLLLLLLLLPPHLPAGQAADQCCSCCCCCYCPLTCLQASRLTNMTPWEAGGQLDAELLQLSSLHRLKVGL